MKSCKEEEDDGGLWSQRGHSSKCFWMKNRRTKKQGGTRIPKQDFIAVDQSRVSFVSLPKPKNAVQSTRNNSFLVITLTVLSTAILLALIIFAVYAKLSKNVVSPACVTSEQNQEPPGQLGRTIPSEEVQQNKMSPHLFQMAGARQSDKSNDLVDVEIWMFSNLNVAKLPSLYLQVKWKPKKLL